MRNKKNINKNNLKKNRNYKEYHINIIKWYNFMINNKIKKE